MKGKAKPIKQKESQGGRVMRQNREEDSLKMKSKTKKSWPAGKMNEKDSSY